jgi:diguanylate cyclase (GGDEF)-like protein
MDPRTSILIGSITCALMAIVLTSLSKATPLPVPGFRAWVVGSWMIFIALLMLGLRDWAPQLASVTLGNCALMLAYLVWFSGTLEYFGQRVKWIPWLAVVAVATVAVSWFVYGDESFRARVVIVAGVCAVINACHAFAAWRSARRSDARALGRTATLVWLAALVFIYGLRGALALAFPQGDSSLLSHDLTQVIYTGSFTVCNMMLVIGFATMASDYVRVYIERQATRDPLTGALNRRACFNAIGLELSRSQRQGHSFCIAMLDIDHFKNINDRFGHLVGDRVLTTMCKRVEGLVRPHDVFARYGGEEFLILMPETGLSNATQATQRLLGGLAVSEDDTLPAITVSIGVAEWSTDDGSIESLIARADSALYAAKKNGRNCINIAPAQKMAVAPSLLAPN